MTWNELARSLALAQAEMPAAKFDSTNPHFKSRFASLNSVAEVARIAARHGIGFMQTIEQEEEKLRAVTLLLHTSGQYIISRSPWFKPAKSDAHGVAGAVTYARRVGLSTAFCITADEDNDGNTAAGKDGAITVPAPELPSLPPEESIFVPDDLKEAAIEAASRGTDTYREWFANLTKAQRKLILPLHEDLKDKASAATNAA